MTSIRQTPEAESPPSRLRASIKRAFAPLAAALLCVGALACGGTNKNVGSVSQSAAASGGAHATTPAGTAPPGSYLKSDEDNDGDDGNQVGSPDRTDILFATGKEADQVDKRAVTALIKRYYAAAAAGDGAEACPLLYSTLARGLAEGQGQSGQSGGNACAAALSSLFEQQRQQLEADQVATMVVPDVRLTGSIGTATVGFRAVPVGHFFVKRERGVWKIDALFQTGMT